MLSRLKLKNDAKKKLPTWFNTKNIYYPNKLNIEQTSSEITANYKSKLISGDSLIDLTSGFGVDCYYFSKQFKTVEYCEIDALLSQLVKHNYKQLGVDNIYVQNNDGIQCLKESNTSYDWIYADPSRRHDSKGKVFFLNDCSPDIPKQLDLLFKHTKNILIKTSPLLDLSVGLGELSFVKAIHIVAVNNEVKELLWILEKDYAGGVSIHTVNMAKNNTVEFHFSNEDEKYAEAIYSNPLTYLYEPNVAILKAGAFNTIAKRLNVYKLQKHSHLYTSEGLIDFPGRRFKIKSIMPYNAKNLKKLGLKKANITTRNFPETVQHIRKKLQIKDGGDNYLFFTTDKNSKRLVMITTKI